jgi:hypothetical protein
MSSVDDQGNFAKFSASGQGIKFAAPGVNIQNPNVGGGYRSSQGNSLAAALTAGVVALIKAKYPNVSADGVFQRLKATAVDKGPPGWDAQYGYGVINPLAALTADVADPSGSGSAPAVSPAGKSAGGKAEGKSAGASEGLRLGLVGLGGVAVVVILVASVMGLRRRRIH